MKNFKIIISDSTNITLDPHNKVVVVSKVINGEMVNIGLTYVEFTGILHTLQSQVGMSND